MYMKEIPFSIHGISKPMFVIFLRLFNFIQYTKNLTDFFFTQMSFDVSFSFDPHSHNSTVIWHRHMTHTFEYVSFMCLPSAHSLLSFAGIKQKRWYFYGCLHLFTFFRYILFSLVLFLLYIKKHIYSSCGIWEWVFFFYSFNW